MRVCWALFVLAASGACAPTSATLGTGGAASAGATGSAALGGASVTAAGGMTAQGGAQAAVSEGGTAIAAAGRANDGGAAARGGSANAAGTLNSGGADARGGSAGATAGNSAASGGVSANAGGAGRAGGGTAIGGSATGGALSAQGGTSAMGGRTSAALGGAQNGGSAGVAGYPPLTANVTLHVAGDSTACIFPTTDPTGRVGWASVLQQFFASGVTVDDAAQSGRSSKSFIDEGFWTSLKAKIHSGDYVFIEFGHNDEKSDDPARYTDAATTYRDYLTTYVTETRSLGGFPVLLTPISRRQFSGTTIVATHGAYPAAVIAVGQKTGTPVSDMTEKTRVFLESLGPQATIPLFATDDNTHLSATGAPQIAKLAVQGIRELMLPIAQRLKP